MNEDKYERTIDELETHACNGGRKRFVKKLKKLAFYKHCWIRKINLSLY